MKINFVQTEIFIFLELKKTSLGSVNRKSFFSIYESKKYKIMRVQAFKKE